MTVVGKPCEEVVQDAWTVKEEVNVPQIRSVGFGDASGETSLYLFLTRVHFLQNTPDSLLIIIAGSIGGATLLTALALIGFAFMIGKQKSDKGDVVAGEVNAQRSRWFSTESISTAERRRTNVTAARAVTDEPERISRYLPYSS